MYEYRPPRRNHKAHIMVLLLLLLAGCFFAVSGIVPRYPAIPQTLGLFLLVPVVQLVARYMAVQYLYRLHEMEDGSTDLEVFSYRGGAQMQLICRVALFEITATAPLTPETRRPKKGLKRYGFSPDLAPERGLVLSVTNEDGDCEILLCPDEAMERILTAAPAEAVRPVYDPATGEDALPEDAE